MQGIFENLLPLIVFFGCYKLYGLYAATAVLLLTTILSAIFGYWRKRKVDYLQLISSGVILIMATATLALRAPLLIKLKPTAVYWLFAGSFAVCRCWIGCPTMIGMMLKQLPQKISGATLKRLDWLWGVSFGLLGAVNLWVAYRCSTDTWVNFKLFGSLGWLLVTSLVQGIIIYQDMPTEGEEEGRRCGD